ncbi:hypothetical protein PAXRUDRAFT_131941, partial [Paxillus rubicundulus Ve08.2h10]
GYRAAQVLAAGLPSGWRVVLVDRNSHFNHVYNLPRYAVLPGHEHKAFIPYDNLFNNPSFSSPSLPGHKRIHATITALHPHHITYIEHQVTPTSDSPSPLQRAEDKNQEQMLHFDYAIYALGSHLPAPIDLWGSRNHQPDGDVGPPISRSIDCATHSEPRKNSLRPYTGTKLEGVSWLRSRQRKVEEARNVVVVGGGALGIQFASDLAAIHPRKCVTLLHSRSRLLPKFDEALGNEVLQGLQELGVHVILGERLDMSSLKDDGGTGGARAAKTMKGRELNADLLLFCTGQTPNTSLLHSMDPGTINPESGMVRVSRSMQVEAQPSPTPSSPRTLYGTVPPSPPRLRIYPQFFAIGDVADAFGAIKAGHTAYYQGQVAARNVVRLVKRHEAAENLELEEYTPGPPMIRVSLGLTKSAYEVAGVVGTKDDGTEDLGAEMIWGTYGYRDVDEEGMWR